PSAIPPVRDCAGRPAVLSCNRSPTRGIELWKDHRAVVPPTFYGKGKTVLQEPVTRVLQASSSASPSATPSVWIRVVPCAAQIVVAVVLGQTLFFKFTDAPATQVLFANRGGRPAATAVGIAELLCVLLLLVPRTAAVGAALSLLVISGAIFTH